ncbi:MAG: MaoC family dehydratase N-terminal domain-containing protein, partial [bacterium]
MPLNFEEIMAWEMPEVAHAYSRKDTILYALGLGLGADPVDPGQLGFVYEESLRALPTMAAVLAGPGLWFRDPRFGVDWKRVLHGEQGITLHKPLPPEGELIGRPRIREILDKGEKGALIYGEREIRNGGSGELLATVRSTTFARGGGGFGGKSGPTPPVHELPEGAPEETCDLPTLPQSALIYRLSGDANPLHADPGVAREAG